MLNRDWFAGLTIAVALLGCGDDDGSDAPNTSSAAATCARGCSAASAARCPNQPITCQQQCEESIATTPASCTGYVNQYAECAKTAVFSCDATGVAEAEACEPELVAWQNCRNGVAPTQGTDSGTPVRNDAGTQPPINNPDAGTPGGNDASAPRVDGGVPVDASIPVLGGDAGIPLGDVFTCEPRAGDGACDTCIKTMCCQAVTDCNGECDEFATCANKCDEEDDACNEACLDQYPDGFVGLYEIELCKVSDCAASCPQS